MTKRTFALAFLLIWLAACGGDSSKNEQASSEQNTPPTSTTKEDTPQTPSEETTTETTEDATPSFVDFFAKNFVGKSQTGVLNGITAAIDPETGIYMVHTIGANPVIANYQTVAQMQETIPDLGNLLADINCQLSEEPLPTLNAEGRFEKQGCFTQEVSGSIAISERYQEIADLLLISYEEAELEAAKQADAKISRMVLLTKVGVKMGFALKDGEWKLSLLDLYSFEMGV